MSEPQTRGHDEDLVQRARAGDPEAFEGLMRRHNQRLFRVARAVLGEEAEAEDTVQDAYLRAFRHFDRYQSGNFGGWILTIALNEARGRVRRRARAFARHAEAGPELDPRASHERADPERDLARAEIGALIEGAVDELPDGYREVFMLREVEHMDTRETAHCLELTEATVRTRLHRARAMLRDTLSDRIAAELPHAFEFAGERCDRIVAAVLHDLGRQAYISH